MIRPLDELTEDVLAEDAARFPPVPSREIIIAVGSIKGELRAARILGSRDRIDVDGSLEPDEWELRRRTAA